MPTARGRGDAVAPSRLLARLAAVLVAALLLALLAGCGVGAQDRGEPAPLPEALPTPPRPPGSGGGEDLLVHLVSGTHLSPVRRAVPERRPQDAVDQLMAGPTRAEVLAGLRTALSPQHLSVLTGPDHGGTVTVTLTRGFTGIGGGNQLLAVAQVAWTVTQFPRVDDVLFEGVYDTAFYDGADGYVGEEVVLSADVNDVITPESSTIAGTDDPSVEALLVVGATGDTPLAPETTVEVTGTVMESFVLTDGEDELGVDLDDALFTEWEQEPYVVAEDVEVLEDAEG